MNNKLIKTKNKIIQAIGKYSNYDKDTMENIIYYAEDKKKILINNTEYGGSDIVWKNVGQTSVIPYNIIYFKNIKNVTLNDGVLEDDTSNNGFLPPEKEQLRNQKKFKGIAELHYGDNIEKLLISEEGLNFELDKEQDVFIKIKPLTDPSNSSLRIPEELSDSVDKIEIMELDGKVVSFIRPNYIYQTSFDNPPKVYKINYIVKDTGKPIANKSFMLEKVDAELVSNFSELNPYSFFSSNIVGDLNIKKNQIINSNSISRSRVSGDVTISQDTENINANSFDSINSDITKIELINTKTIGSYAFSFLKIKDDNFVLPKTLTDIGSNAFYRTQFNQASLTIPKSVVSLGKAAFFDVSNVGTINVYETTSGIKEAFRGPVNIIKVQDLSFDFDMTDESVKSYKLKLVGLNKFDVKGSVDNAPYSLNQEFTFDKKSNVRFISDPSKYNMNNPTPGYSLTAKLTSSKTDSPTGGPINGVINISLEKVDYDGKSMVYSPFSLIEAVDNNSSLTFNVKTEEADIAGADSLTILSLDNYPKGVKEIAPFAFNSLPMNPLTDLKLPDSVEIIHRDAFSGWCLAESLDIPSSVKLIKSRAFFNLRNTNPTKKINVLVSKDTVLEENAFNTNDYKIVYK